MNEDFSASEMRLAEASHRERRREGGGKKGKRRPGRFSVFAYHAQGPAVLLLPLAVIFAPGGLEYGGWMMLLGLQMAVCMVAGQSAIWISTAIHARRVGVLALGRLTLLTLMAYCACVVLYCLSAIEVDDARDYPSILMKMRMSNEMTHFLAENAIRIGAAMLLAAVIVSLVDRPKVSKRGTLDGEEKPLIFS